LDQPDLKEMLSTWRGNIAQFLKILLSSCQRKHVCRWLFSLRRNYLLDKQMPWLTFDAIEFIESRLWEGMQVFEYGSGGSTLFWLKHGATCVSIGHNPDWYSIVRQRLVPECSIDYRLVLPELVKDSGWQGDPADPETYVSSDGAYHGYSFRKYVMQIDAFPDRYFNVVMIDGRARPSCIMHGAGKVRPGGLLILDNAERLYYTAKTQECLEDFTCQQFYGVGPCGQSMWRTDVYTRRR
jgi:hypothetical protein